MGESKRYYWLKITEDFFRQKEIKKLRRIAGGDTYTVIYLKMLVHSLKNDGKLYYEGVEADFISELAYDIDEDVDNVAITVRFLISHNMLIQNNENEYSLTTTKEMTGSECASAERVRRMRAVKQLNGATASQCDAAALQCNTAVTGCNSDVQMCNTEKEKELHPELHPEPYQDSRDNIYTNNGGVDLGSDWVRFVKVYNANIGSMPTSEVECTDLQMFYDEFGVGALCEIVREVARKHADNPHRYFSTICRKWLGKGIKTVEQVHAAFADYTRANQRNYQKPEEPLPQNDRDKMSVSEIMRISMEETMPPSYYWEREKVRREGQQ